MYLFHTRRVQVDLNNPHKLAQLSYCKAYITAQVKPSAFWQQSPKRLGFFSKRIVNHPVTE